MIHISVIMHVCVCVCVCVCILYVCVYVCMFVCVFVCIKSKMPSRGTHFHAELLHCIIYCELCAV